MQRMVDPEVVDYEADRGLVCLVDFGIFPQLDVGLQSYAHELYCSE